MLTQEEIEQIEISNVEAKKAVEIGEALQRLLASPDYNLVVEQEYFLNYPKELAVSIARNTGAYDEARLLKDLTSINTLQTFIFRLAQNYNAAVQTLTDNEEYIANSGSEE